MQTMPQTEDSSREEAEDFTTSEEDAEASFHFFIQDVNWYVQNGTWGPKIWEALSEETRLILSNFVHLQDMGYKMKGTFSVPND